jgi:alkylation response protein AidB-like acyl-CoA dehydrogenase
VQVLMATEAIARYGCPSTAVIFMMHLVAVGGLVFRAHANPEIQSLLRRMDGEALIGTASYTDPETGGHFWYPKTSSAERVADGWHVRKTAAFTTSSGYASWYLTQTTSPEFSGDYSDLSVFLLYPDEVQANPGVWDAMGMHANQSGPVEIDAVIPFDRIVGPVGDGARSNDEAIDPLAFLQYAGAYNGEYVVADTGRKVRGRHIDIYLPDNGEAKRFGKKQVRVEILKYGQR